MRTVRLALVAWTLVSVTALAASVWETAPFTEWSDKDVEKVLTDSPWAGKASVTHARIGADLGPVPDWKVIVTVRSALPVKQALLRQQIGKGGAVTPEQAAMLTTADSQYIVSISGIPRMYSMGASQIAGSAHLRREHKESLRPVQARMIQVDKTGKPLPPAAPAARGRGFPGGAPGAGSPPAGGAPAAAPPAGDPSSGDPPAGGGFGGGAGGFGGGGFGGGFGGEDKSGITATLILSFPKDSAITAADGSIEITAVIGTYEIKKSFKLKDMTLKGELAL